MDVTILTTSLRPIFTVTLVWNTKKLVTFRCSGDILNLFRTAFSKRMAPSLQILDYNGILNLDEPRFEKRLINKWSRVQMESEIHKPNHLKSRKMAAILSKTIWNPNKNVQDLNGFQMVGTKSDPLKTEQFAICSSKSLNLNVSRF